ncbi:MAG: cupin domain-containing protein [Chloroflexota bacterium]|nr:cupin domain-containing protein [Chloroflexota bacterium]MDQ6907207.1 cupin domain-containing protein [Chloroflexota bacterium]
MATDTGSKPQFFQVAALPDVQILSTVPELKARLVAGDRLLAMFGNAEPNASLPLHSHPHEQITYVLEGAIHFQVGDAGHDLVPGEGLVIPGGVTHGGIRVGPEGCRFVEIFTPLRDEYVALMPKAKENMPTP